ncbi:arylamine N-acetyltransferase [Kitasatospora sp. NPDC048239]|uniref:arylamine N-acetyltransferase family protein n=1 Tax=Kitasatospora sp. NPDC048239 TaxID=3364046 RepID=UPI00371C7570
MPTTTTAGYLDRLGLPGDLAPTVENLRRLHRAHVERIPYETLDFQLGTPAGIDPQESFDRIGQFRRGGYCFQLNGAFLVLLGELGYQVGMHRVGVQKVDEAEPAGVNGNHMALTVGGLPTPQSPDGRWLVDVGLGFAFHEPLPLRTGLTEQGPFGYRLSESSCEPGGWRLDHRPLRGFAGADISVRPARAEDFADQHAHLSTSPESDFVRLARVQRRDALGTDLLLGRVLTRIDGTGDQRRELTSPDEWFEVLRTRFGLPLDELGAAGRERLWAVVCDGHESWLRQG